MKDRTEQDQLQENSTDDLEKNEAALDSPRSEDLGKSFKARKEEGKFRSLSSRSFNCQGKNLRINIPLTTPSRTFSTVSYLLREDLLNQSSKKCNPEGSKLQINRKRLHHAEKMIRGAFIELYKGLGYLKTYRYSYLIKLHVPKELNKVTSIFTCHVTFYGNGCLVVF